jgi:hypothetical protein
MECFCATGPCELCGGRKTWEADQDDQRIVLVSQVAVVPNTHSRLVVAVRVWCAPTYLTAAWREDGRMRDGLLTGNVTGLMLGLMRNGQRFEVRSEEVPVSMVTFASMKGVS